MKNKIFYLPKFQDSGTLPKSTEHQDVDSKLLQNVGETILDFTPIIGDIKGLTIDPYRAYQEDGWKGGLTMMGLGLLGLVPFIGDAAKKGLRTTRKIYKGLAETSNKSIRRRKNSSFSLDNLLSKPLDTWNIEGTDWDILEYKKLKDFRGKDWSIDEYIQTQLIDRAKKEGKWSDIIGNLFTNNEKIGDIKIAMGKPKVETNTRGWYLPDKRQIILNINNPKQARTLIHEFRHLLDAFPKGANTSQTPIRLTNSERNALSDAYRIRVASKDLLNHNTFKNADNIKEQIAENATYRFFAWLDFRKKYKKNPTVDELTKHIQNADDDTILKFMDFDSKYPSDYSNAYKDYLNNIDVENVAQKKIDDDNDLYYQVTYGTEPIKREYGKIPEQIQKIRNSMATILGLSGIGIITKNRGENEDNTNRN